MSNFDIEEIVNGYAKGYFLMPDEHDDDTLCWYKSRERTLIPLDDRFRYPTSLNRVLNQNRFSVGVNQAFMDVVDGCANRQTTWINDQLKDMYLKLYHEGIAYSFETWQNGKLAGGILGIVLGKIFIGESMFYNIPDGSKVAMVKLVERLRERGFMLFDAQMMNAHLARFGAYIIQDEDYNKLLNQALQGYCEFD